MKLFHGSDVIIHKPDLRRCRPHRDFGRGFYLTPQWRRAKAIASDRAEVSGNDPRISVFEFDLNGARKAGLNILEFKRFTLAWACFVLKNRIDTKFKHQYDVVIGPVADGPMVHVILAHKAKYGNDYLHNEALKDFVKNTSQFGLSYIQYCFCTKRAIEFLEICKKKKKSKKKIN